MEKCCTAEQAADGNMVWRVRIACWINKATNTHSECVIFVAFPLQNWLHERTSILHCSYMVRLATFSCHLCNGLSCGLLRSSFSKILYTFLISVILSELSVSTTAVGNCLLLPAYGSKAGPSGRIEHMYKVKNGNITAVWNVSVML